MASCLFIVLVVVDAHLLGRPDPLLLAVDTALWSAAPEICDVPFSSAGPRLLSAPLLLSSQVPPLPPSALAERLFDVPTVPEHSHVHWHPAFFHPQSGAVGTIDAPFFVFRGNGVTPTLTESTPLRGL